MVVDTEYGREGYKTHYLRGSCWTARHHMAREETGVGTIHWREETGVGTIHWREETGGDSIHPMEETGVDTIHPREETGVDKIHSRVISPLTTSQGKFGDRLTASINREYLEVVGFMTIQ